MSSWSQVGLTLPADVGDWILYTRLAHQAQTHSPSVGCHGLRVASFSREPLILRRLSHFMWPESLSFPCSQSSQHWLWGTGCWPRPPSPPPWFFQCPPHFSPGSPFHDPFHEQERALQLCAYKMQPKMTTTPGKSGSNFNTKEREYNQHRTTLTGWRFVVVMILCSGPANFGGSLGSLSSPWGFV